LLSIILMYSFEVSANNIALGEELGEAIGEDMKIKYTCEKYLGGLGSYIIAKNKVVEYFVNNSDADKNKAVEVVANLERRLIRNASNELLDLRFDKRGTPEETRKKICKDLVNQ